MRPSTPVAAPSKPRLLFEKLLFFGEKSACHGIPNFVRTDRWILKILWLVFVLLFAYFCAKNIIQSFIGYFAFEVNTNIEVVRDSDADFPTVSICILQVCGLDPDNTYKNVYLPWTVQKDFNQTGKLTQQQLDANLTSYNLETLIDSSRNNFLTNFSKTDLRTMFPLSGVNQTIRYNIISCMYSSEYCYQHDFTWFQVNEFQQW
jgi:hypothetical protein